MHERGDDNTAEVFGIIGPLPAVPQAEVQKGLKRKRFHVDRDNS